MGVKLVFAVTNFGTRVGVPVSEDCTAEQFKKTFESVHYEIHPGHGKLRVDSLEVKWKYFFYRLSDSIPVVLALKGGDQILHIVASKSEKRELLNKRKKKRQGIVLKSFEEKEEEDGKKKAVKISSLSQEEKGFWTNGSDHQRQGIHDASLELQAVDIEGLSEPVSKTISVTGIINKYFSTCDDEVNSYSSPLVTLFPIVPEELQLHDEPKRTRVGVPKKTSVGARVIEASQSFGISSTKKSPAHHLSKLIDGGSTAHKSARMLVFD